MSLNKVYYYYKRVSNLTSDSMDGLTDLIKGRGPLLRANRPQ